MLKKFCLKNYKNFKEEICVDFEKTAGYQFGTDCLSNGLISKMLIYGKNATGKTNLGKALLDIAFTMFGTAADFRTEGVFLNADSTEQTASFQYTFQFGTTEVGYRYTRFSELRLCEEELRVDEQTIFHCDFASKKYEFSNLQLVGAETANTERYVQSLENAGPFSEPELPFLRWILSNVALKKDSVLLQLSDYVRRMTRISAGNSIAYPTRRNSFYDTLEDPEKLNDFESFLNAMGISCNLILKRLPDGQKELYFAHEKLVPFYANASSGTLALADLYQRLISKVGDASFVYLDEFDAFYHYEMSENVIRFFKQRYPECQIVMTSHNTNLMTNRIMRPDCLFILSQRGTLTALCSATERELREGHNLEKMYISGEFEKYE